MTDRHRPYLTGRNCGRCIVPLETTERREGGWLYVTYRCACCSFNQVVTFSPQELAEWARRQSLPRQGQKIAQNAF